MRHARKRFRRSSAWPIWFGLLAFLPAVGVGGWCWRQARESVVKREAPEESPDSLGVAALLREDPHRVGQHAREALAQDPSDRAAFNALSMSYNQIRAEGLSQTAEADLRRQEIDDYGSILEIAGDVAEVLFRVASQRLALERLLPPAQSLERRELLEEGTLELQRVVTLLEADGTTEELASAHHQLGRAFKHHADLWLEQGEEETARPLYDRALAEFHETLAVDSARIDSLGEIILAHRQLGQPEVALQTARSQLSQLSNDKASAKVYEMVGALYLETSRAGEAVQAFERALELDPARMGSYLNLFELHYQSGSLAEAASALEAALKVEPNFLDGYAQLGRLYMESSRGREAVDTFEKALRIAPVDAELAGMFPSKNVARNQLYYYVGAALAWLYLEEENDAEKALAAVNEAKRYQDPDAHLLDTLAWIHYKRGDRKEARRILLSVTDDGKSIPAAHYHLAQIYFDEGELERSEKAVAMALRSREEFSGRSDAQELARHLKEVLGRTGSSP